MRSRRYVAFAALLALASLPVLADGVAARGAPGASSRHAAIVSHWTEARMRAAVPRDFAFDSVRGYHLNPHRKPGGGGGSGSTPGASWPNGKGLVYVATGKVFFDMGGGSWVCSGTALTDTRQNVSLVVTAGHCAYDESVVHSQSAFATNWMFIPQFDSNPTFTCSATAYGCWTASALVVNDGFASAGGFNTRATHYDWAFAVVGPGGKNNTQLDARGTFALQASAMGTNTVVDAFGYPAAGKYHGNDLTYCQNPLGFDALTGNTNYKLACNMTGGSSGGPWFSGFAAANGSSTGDAGVIRSLNSYGYSGQSNMYGPIFNANTTNTLNAANSATTTNTFVACNAPCN